MGRTYVTGLQLHIFFYNLQALGAIPSVNSDLVQQRLNRVRTYYELLNMPFEVNC